MLFFINQFVTGNSCLKIQYIDQGAPVVSSANYYRNIENLQLIETHLIQIKMNTLSEINPNTTIFKPVTPQVVSDIFSDTLQLQSAFKTSSNKHQQLTLLMTSYYIVVCRKHGALLDYLYYADLEFDLKFELIHELDGQKQSEIAIYSQLIGFRLFKGNHPATEFFPKLSGLMDIWARYLTKSLNQLGFHKFYKPIKKLGKGASATVYQVERVTDHQHFAVKAFSKSNTLNSSNPIHRNNLMNQIEMLRSFNCPNLIKLEAVFESQNSLYLVLELLADGQLHSRINQKQAKFSTAQIKQLIFGLMKGLQHMHSQRIMHRDIKPQNIMLRGKEGLQPVIADFGLSACVDAQDYLYYRCGTPGYVAPEITSLKQGQKVQPQCDIFSVGVILHILLVKKPLFEGKNCDEVYENNRKLKFNLIGSIYKHVDPLAFDLLKKMLKVDPKDRIKAHQVLQHPFLDGMMKEEQGKMVLSPASTANSQNIMDFGEAQKLF